MSQKGKIGEGAGEAPKLIQSEIASRSDESTTLKYKKGKKLTQEGERGRVNVEVKENTKMGA